MLGEQYLKSPPQYYSLLIPADDIARQICSPFNVKENRMAMSRNVGAHQPRDQTRARQTDIVPGKEK